MVAIDWSGAKGEGKHPGIWVTAMRGDELVVDRGSWSRAEAVDFVMTQPAPVVAGFDFSFGVPAWFARELGCPTIDQIWACEMRLRAAGLPAKSVFQLVGNGQVGRGSVRGMPHLARLRAEGFAIWPFDGARDRTAIEIYPSLLRRRFPDLDDGAAPTNDARDARVSARAMTARAEELSQLAAARDHVTRIEGDVWIPAVTSP